MKGPITEPGNALRPYQDDALQGLKDGWAGGANPPQLVILPTGLGKTVLVGHLIRWHLETVGTPALFVAHTKELIDQGLDKLATCGVMAVPEKAEYHARALIAAARQDLYDPRDIRCVMGCVASLKGRRLETWPKNYFGLVVVDEVHHARADSYAGMIQHFADGGAKIVGVTATPKRADGRCISEIFRRIAYQVTLAAAITKGWLCPVTTALSDVQVDLRGLAITAGDYSVEALEEVILPRVADLSAAIAETLAGGQRQFLVFTPDVRTARCFGDILAGLGLPCRGIAGVDKDRDETLEAFRAGELRGLACCSLLTEGFDHPPVAAIALCRPTKSPVLMAQMIGRGTRLAHGKTDNLILDFAWQADRVKGRLVRPFEILADAPLTERERDVAEGLLEDGLQPQALVDRAREVVWEQDHLEALRRAAEDERRRRAQQDRHYGPSSLTLTQRTFLGGSGAPGLEGLLLPGPLSESRSTKGPASPKQIDLLIRFGMSRDVALGLARDDASRRLDVLVQRANAGLATARQLAVVLRAGIPRNQAETLTRAEASELIDGMARGWRRRA